MKAYTLLLLDIILLVTGFCVPTTSQLTASGDYPSDCIASAVEGAEKGIRSLRCNSFPDQVPETVVYLNVKRFSPATLDAGHLTPLKNLKMLNLQGLDIEIIVENALATLPNLEVLNLDETKITRLTNLTFHGCTSLVELRMDFLKLKHIQLGTFVSLRSLRRLHMSNSDLYEIPSLLPGSLNELILANNFLTDLPEVIEPLEKLERLDLSGNNFKRFSAKNFKAPNLGILRLGDQIADIEAGTFDNQAILHTLELRSKRLTLYGILKRVSVVQSLQTLKVYDAHIGEVDDADATFRLPNLKHLQLFQVQGTPLPKLFHTMTSLETLDLHSSPDLARSILNSDEILENFPNLTMLGLQETETTQLREEHLSRLENLKKINLVANPIHCDCNLTWLVSRVRHLRLQLDHPSQTVCSSPNHLYALQLTNEAVLTEICISVNQSSDAKTSGSTDSPDQDAQTSTDEEGVNLSHVLYAIIGLAVLVAILIIVVIITQCLPKWRERRRKDTNDRKHRNSLDLLPRRSGSFDTFAAHDDVIPYTAAKTPPNPPVRCTSTFKRRTSQDVAC